MIFVRKASAQSPPSSAVVQGVLNAAIPMHNSLTTSSSYSAAELQTLINSAQTFFGNLEELNLNNVLGQCIYASATNAPGYLTFNAENAQTAYNGALSLGFPAVPGLFTAHTAAQPTQSKVQAIQNAATFLTAQANHMSGLNKFLSMLPGSNLMSSDGTPFCNPSQSDSGDANMIAAGGVITAGGGGLIGAAGAAGSVLGAGFAAEVTAVLLLSSGVALVAIGIAIAGYYAYQYVQRRWSAKDCLPPKTGPALA